MNFLRSGWATLQKDMRIEWRGRARAQGALCFATLVLLLFSFAAGPDAVTLGRHAPGYVWLAILLTSTLSLSESMRVEMDDRALEGLRLLPVDMRGFFLGKLVSNALFLCCIALILFPMSFALFEVKPTLGFARLAGVVLSGSMAISAPGTIYATMATQLKARDILFPMLLFPVLVPALVASVKATSLVLFGDPMHEFGGWMSVLVIFAFVYSILGIVLFERIVEE